MVSTRFFNEASRRVLRLGGAGVSISSMLKDLLLALASLLVVISHPTPVASTQDVASKQPLAPLDFLIGRWEGSSEGQIARRLARA